ncbi:MAG: GIY-YIG nuclease family protein [Salinivirgaceae bacterium]
MEFVVYILFSEKHQKHYTGFTSDLISRFHSHNELSTKGWTIRYRPWKVIHVEFFASKTAALDREKYLKSGKGREYLQQEIFSTL